LNATLTITYKYENQAYKPRKDGNVYGWDDDPKQGKWHVHREEANATGAKEKPNQNNQQ
jgi:hypothetical protein